MKIYSLISDVQYLLTQRGWVTPTVAADLGDAVSRRLVEQFAERTSAPQLRLSRMGPQCPCALWHSIHKPELAEPMPPWAEMKFSFGHIIEAQAIMLAKAAGHEVTGEQDVISVDGVEGHRDCVIDGCIVDVKSISRLGLEDFRSGNQDKLDAWGYLSQLDGYLLGSLHDPLVQVKDRAFLWGIEKQLGHMCLYEHKFDEFREKSIRNRIRSYKEIVGRDNPPNCTCGVVPDGGSGNFRLDTKASYNAFKFCCFPHLRTFLYASGPRYLTKVEKLPTYMGKPIPEVDKLGNKIYK